MTSAAKRWRTQSHSCPPSEKFIIMMTVLTILSVHILVVMLRDATAFPLFCIGEITSVEALRPLSSCDLHIWQGSWVMQLHDRMQGQNVALENRKEWCIISETLFHSTNYWSIHRKCAQMPPSSGNMEGSTSWVTIRNGLNKVWLGALPPRYPGSANSAVWYIVCSAGHITAHSLQLQCLSESGSRTAACSCTKIGWNYIKVMRTHHKQAKLHSCLNKLNLTLNICVFL